METIINFQDYFTNRKFRCLNEMDHIIYLEINVYTRNVIKLYFIF